MGIFWFLFLSILQTLLIITGIDCLLMGVLCPYFAKKCPQERSLPSPDKEPGQESGCRHGQPSIIQIMSTASTKWNGIQTMLKAVGVNPKDAIYFGDDNDDIEPIKNCGVGVAGSNAIDKVLDVADDIAESNDMDGVARYIEKNLIGGAL